MNSSITDVLSRGFSASVYLTSHILRYTGGIFNVEFIGIFNHRGLTVIVGRSDVLLIVVPSNLRVVSRGAKLTWVGGWI